MLFCGHSGDVFRQDAGWKKVRSLTLALLRAKYPTLVRKDGFLPNKIGSLRHEVANVTRVNQS